MLEMSLSAMKSVKYLTVNTDFFCFGNSELAKSQSIKGFLGGGGGGMIQRWCLKNFLAKNFAVNSDIFSDIYSKKPKILEISTNKIHALFDNVNQPKQN